MKLMEELYSIDQTAPTSLVYPVIISPNTDGAFLVAIPDFPHVQFEAPTLEYGLRSVKDIIRDELSGMVCPPPATPLTGIAVAPTQLLIQVPV